MNNEFSLLSDMQQDCKLYGMVELDQLRSMWKPRKYPIEVAVSLVQSGLLPSIFDWALIGQLMPAEQSMGEMMLQQRINDLELLNSLTTSLQRIQILPETGVEVDVVMGRPSYNVQVQDDGKIVVKELPSLHIHIYAVEPRAAAGQEAAAELLEQGDVVELKAAAAVTKTDDPEVAAATVVDAEINVQTEEMMCLDELEKATTTTTTTTATTTTTTKATTTTTTTTTSIDLDGERQQMISDPACAGCNAGGNPGASPSDDFLPFFEDSTTLTDVEDPSDYLSECEEPVDMKLHRRMSFWMRFGNWLRQSMPRLT